MKDAVGSGYQLEVSRQDVFEDYVHNYLAFCTQAGPCRDDKLLSRATQVVQREPEPGHSFSLFPLEQVLMENCVGVRRDWRKQLTTVITAMELLETVCVNLYLQPWRKEIKTLKTFTGPFVYCLLPAFSPSTIQSVLASIGYLPHTNICPPSEYRLSEDANPDRALQMGFELLLARAQCLHLLDQDQLTPQEWLETLQKKTKENTENKTTEPVEEEQRKKEEEEEEEEEKDTQRKEVSVVSVSQDHTPAVNPKPKPRRSHLYNVDQSLIEMHMNYPDLSIRGRPVLQDKPPRGNRSCSKAALSGSAVVHNDHSPATQPVDKDPGEGSRTPAALNTEGHFFECRSSDGMNSPGLNMSSSRAGGPSAMSLHITLRTGAEYNLKSGQDQGTVQPVVTTQQSAQEQQSKSSNRADMSSVSSVDEAQDLRELAHRMGQLNMDDNFTDNPEKTLDEDPPTERRSHLRHRVKTNGRRRSSRTSHSEQRQEVCQEESQDTEAEAPPTAEVWPGDDNHGPSYV